MRNIIKKYKSQIIVGAVGSIIGACIMGVGNWFISTAPKIGSSILETISNVIYTSAATLTNGGLIAAIFGALFAVGSFEVLSTMKEGLPVLVALSKIEKDLKTHHVKTHPDNADEIIKKHISSIKADKHPAPQAEIIDDILKKRNLIIFLLVVLVLLSIGLFAIVVLLFLGPISLQDQFNQDITIIYPYVEERQILQLKSDWTLMRSKADYFSIYEYINMIKEEYGLFR